MVAIPIHTAPLNFTREFQSFVNQQNLTNSIISKFAFMLDNLKDNEKEAATKLINGGLAMAKASMEKILQSPITIKKIDYGNEEQSLPVFDYKEDDNIHLLKTELKGELKGSCHLIFSEENVEKIIKACLPPSILNDDSPNSKMMKMGFLTEIDNMVAAAVITEFANFLNMEIYGHVPSLHLMKTDEVNSFLESESTAFDSIIHFKAIFHGTELDISPDFVWIFNQQFMEKIRELVA